MEEIIFTPSDFVATLNQTLEYVYPTVIIEGELSDFRVSKNRWVYFDLKDELSSVSFFGTVYQLPGPMVDGLLVRIVGTPRLHPRFGFSVNVQSLVPVGEGSLRQAAELLRRQLEKEGLFAPERKRVLPPVPTLVGLITSAGSAAAADFVKVLGERWGGVEIWLVDSAVQGEQAPAQLVAAIEQFSRMAVMPEVLIITRGGGSAQDLAAFNDERVVRAVAASRIPTLVAIGHETDISLAELAADMRASTPSNAAGLLVPDKRHQLSQLASCRTELNKLLAGAYQAKLQKTERWRANLNQLVADLLSAEAHRLSTSRQLLSVLDPRAALKRGYALISKNGKYIRNVGQANKNDELNLQLHDGIIDASVTKISKP